MTHRIVLVDDHALLAQSVAALLTARGYQAETLLPPSLEAVTARLLDAAPQPHAVVLDIDLGDAGRSLPLIRPLTNHGTAVLMVSGSTDDPEVGACLEAGAVGFVSKARPVEDLLAAIDRVLRGDDVLSERERLGYLTALWDFRGHQHKLAEPFRRLTPRESDVLHHLCEGLSVQEIAHHSYVSLATVRTQVRAILTKLGVTSQLEAVARAYRSGWHIMHEAQHRAS